MKDLIECIEVSLESGEILSRQQKMTRQQVTELLNKQSLAGTTALVNIRGFCEAKTFVILTKGKVQPLSAGKAAAGDNVMSLAPILAFSLDLQENGKPETSKTNGRNGKQRFRPRQQSPENNGDDEKMTTPQRRYLFRLLAENMGLKGNEAEDYLKESCEVESIMDIGKAEASQLIDQLLNGGD